MQRWQYVELRLYITQNYTWYANDIKLGAMPKVPLHVILNEMGADGWELVGMYADAYILKRPKGN